MIKLIIFDLDGVLCDCKNMHYEALNKALGSYAISYDEHLTTYDGLNTKSKLAMLTKWKGLPENSHNTIFREKQKQTLVCIKEMKPDNRLHEVLKKLKQDGFFISVASNSVKDTVNQILEQTNLISFVDYIFSNNDTINPKPHPEIYMRAMIAAGVSPKETLILEDSHIGRKGAYDSGAFVMPVKDTYDVTYEKIISYCHPENKPNKWDAGELNVLIPMAGAGTRFVQAGYTFPKPLIGIKGKSMIQTVVDNLNVVANYIFVVNREQYFKYNLETMLDLISPGCRVVIAPELTEGAACTTLLAKEYINSNVPLLIANSDQFLEWDAAEFFYSMNCDGGIVTFKSTHPKWSFARVEKNYVVEVAEKKPISDIATAGVYWWAKGSDYVKYAESMIRKNIKTNGEYYVCPAYNEAISDGKKIKTFEIKKMWGLGDPESLNEFLNDYKKQ